MVTPYLCALASSLAYKETSESVRARLVGLSNWQLVGVSHLNDVDYKGIAIINEVSREIIIAHRGTIVESLNNLKADWDIFLANRPLGSQSAQNFSANIRKNFPNYSFCEVGHSLGAIHAELNAARFGSKAITFDSPGSREILNKENISDIDLDFTTYRTAPSFINTCNGFVGKVIRLYVHHVNTYGPQTTDFAIFSDFNAINTVKNIIKKIGPESLTEYYLDRQHSIDKILDLFDPDIGEPYLQSEVLAWPSRGDFLKWLSTIARPNFGETVNIYADSVIHRNIHEEEKLKSLPGYQLGNFITHPSLDTFSSEKKNVYCHNALQRLSEFYDGDQKFNLHVALCYKLQYFCQPGNLILEKGIGMKKMPTAKEIGVVASFTVGTTAVAAATNTGTALYTGTTVTKAVMMGTTVGIPLLPAAVLGGAVGMGVVGACRWLTQDIVEENQKLKQELQNLTDGNKKKKTEKILHLGESLATYSKRLTKLSEDFDQVIPIADHERKKEQLNTIKDDGKILIHEITVIKCGLNKFKGLSDYAAFKEELNRFLNDCEGLEKNYKVLQNRMRTLKNPHAFFQVPLVYPQQDIPMETEENMNIQRP